MKVWEFILQKKISSSRVILLYVLESKGSSPGRQGFKMAVSSDGDFCGSIGGGIMEHKFVELAKSRLLIPEEEPEVVKQFHEKSAKKNQSGMICSGEQTIFLYEIKEHEISAIDHLIVSMKANRNGTLHLNIDDMSFTDEVPHHPFYLEISDDYASFHFEEKTGLKNSLHIVGGGHCALALSKLMCNMDFYIHVYDERVGLNTIEENSFAHEKHIVSSYAALGSLIPNGDNVYVVIMTFGYRTDDNAVRSLLGKEFKYIGLLGSQKKIEKMFEDYQSEDIDTSLLKKIKAPIGLFIKSETVEEIAVSIAAEIILYKNTNQ